MNPKIYSFNERYGPAVEDPPASGETALAEAKPFKTTLTYVSYIVTSPEKLWAALTSGKMTQQYFGGWRIELGPKTGGIFRFWQQDGTLEVEGKIVEYEPLRKLTVTWQAMRVKECRLSPESLVTFQIEELGKVARLTLTEAHPGEVSQQMLDDSRRDWPVIISGLKTLLEAGRPLPRFDWKISPRGPERSDS